MNFNQFCKFARSGERTSDDGDDKYVARWITHKGEPGGIFVIEEYQYVGKRLSVVARGRIDVPDMKANTRSERLRCGANLTRDQLLDAWRKVK